jgi:FtsP/CotA-like multicopper oxidase with cupredoxin domain
LVNFTGKSVDAIAINGQIPGPTLYFTEGDTAEIYVHNKMHHETSIHWHGLILPNNQDGVPNLTTSPIMPMSVFVYRFPIKQKGTYWYHSHTMLQEQIGLYGALIIKEKNEPVMNEEVVLLSDWTDDNPEEIERSLHYANDWYAIMKGSTQNYWEALTKGYFWTKFENEMKRMHAMDVSDVYYGKFLINGKTQQISDKYKRGDKVKLRIINGSASTYFWVENPGSKITVVASDGTDVVPVEVERLIIGVSETYDVIVEITDDNLESIVRFTAEDRSGYSTLILKDGQKREDSVLPKLKYFEGMNMMNDMMTLGGNMNDMGMKMSLQKMDMNSVMYSENLEDIITLDYSMLKSPVKTKLPDNPFRTLNFELTGNMNRYIWTINNKTVSESDLIMIKKDENIRIIITNNSMMRHPMHLHGHFFRVLNGQGDYSPLKTVLDIMPMETDTIEFNASEESGDWFFHCHILYHMMSGMGRIFRYENTPFNPDTKLDKIYGEDSRFYISAEIGLESNGSDGGINYSNTRWLFQTEWRIGINDEKGYESESHFGKYIDNNQFLFVYTGWDYRYGGHSENKKTIFGQYNTKNQRGVFCIGVQYILPWFLEADFRVDHTGQLRFSLGRHDLPITERLRLWGKINSDFEYSTGARYIITKYFSLSSHYDSDMGIGAGITITY